MTSERNEHIDTILEKIAEEDLVRLITGIDRPLIVDLLRQHPKLHTQLFPGFRPNHPPWTQVPAKLARDAYGNLDNVRLLLDLWLKTNKPLCQMVTEEVNAETLEDDVVELLTSLGSEGKDRLLWALLLDEREDIQKALGAGLREALTSESSTLMVRAERHRLAEALNEAHQEITDLKAQLKDADKQTQLLGRKSRKVDELQADQQHLRNRVDEAETKYSEAVYERDIAYQEIENLQNELARKQVQGEELRQSVDDLKTSLEAAIDSQKENTSEVKHRLDETLTTLEDVRKENAKLRLKANHLEKERIDAFEKRDEIQAQIEELTSQLERLKHDKGVLINEKRKVHSELEKTESTLRNLHETLATVEEKSKTMLALPHFDEAWNKALDELARHLVTTLPEQNLANQRADQIKRWDDWWAWQQMETALVRPVLELSTPVSTEALLAVERVQKLLALRWYLLEWLKFNILEELRKDNLTVKPAKSDEEAR